MDERAERKQPSVEASKHVGGHQNRGLSPVPGRVWREPTYWPYGVRCIGGVTLIRAFVRNLRTWPTMPREKAQAAETARPKVPMRRSGADCSVVVMRRGNACGAKGAGHRRWERANWQQDELQFSTEGGSLRSMARAG